MPSPTELLPPAPDPTPEAQKLARAEVLSVGVTLLVRLIDLNRNAVVEHWEGTPDVGDVVLVGFDEIGDEWVVAGISAAGGAAGAYADLSGIPAAIDAIDGLTPAADRIAYYTGASSAALATLSAYIRTLLDDPDQASVHATLGLGALAVLSTINGSLWSGADLAIADGGTGASTAATARDNLGVEIGADVQAYDADLAAIAALTTTAYGRSLLEAANAAALRTLAGTVIGTDVQAWDADLDTLAANITAFGHSLVNDADAAAGRATLVAAGTGVANAFLTGQSIAAGRLTVSRAATTDGILAGLVAGMLGVQIFADGQVNWADPATGVVDASLRRAGVAALAIDAALAVGGNKITGLAAATANGDALRYEQLVGVYALKNTKADLPASVAYEDEANTFTLGQIIDLAATGTPLTLDVHTNSDAWLVLSEQGTQRGGLYEANNNLAIRALTGDLQLDAIGGNINAQDNQIKSVTDPTAAQDAATKNYVDTKVQETEIDFGATAQHQASFTVTDATVAATSSLIGNVAYVAPTGRQLDDVEMDPMNLTFAPGVGQFTVLVQPQEGRVYGKYKLSYLVG